MTHVAKLFMALLLTASLHAQATTETLRFAHITDTHITPNRKFGPNLQGAIREINETSPPVSFTIATGDLTEMGFTEEYDAFQDVVSALRAPLYVATGNHETKWSNWGNAGPEKFFKQKPYYSFDKGGVHFVGLSSAMWLEHHGMIDKAQLNWLRNDLEKTGTETPVVLFFHHNPGFILNEAELNEAIAPYNVRLVLVGHGHQFKTWARNGVTFQMTAASCNAPGHYRLLEVLDGQIVSSTGTVGMRPELDTTIPLKRQANPITLLPTRHDSSGTTFELNARLDTDPSRFPTIEAWLGSTTAPLWQRDDKSWTGRIVWQDAPGRYRAGVRLLEQDGSGWVMSKPVMAGDCSREIWQKELDGTIMRPATAFEGALLVGTTAGSVFCMDTTSGESRWRMDTGSPVVSQVATDGERAYFGTASGLIAAADLKTGKKAWAFETTGPVQGSPVVGGEKVFIGSGDSVFYALDAASGRLLWKFAMKRMVQTKPVYQSGTVYFGSWDQNFYALDAATGQVRWKTPIGGLIYFSPANSDPATNGKYMFVCGTPWKKEDPDIFCLDAQTGNIVWKRRNPGKSQCGFSSPAAVDGRVYVSSLVGDVYCLNSEDGKELWRTEVGEETYDNSPVVAGGKVYIGGLSGVVHALDAQTGKAAWKYSVGAPCFASCSVSDGRVFEVAIDGTVTALQAN